MLLNHEADMLKPTLLKRSVRLLILVVGLFVLTTCAPDPPNPYEGRTAYVSMAGSGDPWSHLTPERKTLLRALHDGLSPERIEEILNLSRDEILAEIRPLEEIGLVQADHGWYRPDFFIANRRETEMVYAHSEATGRFLAKEVLSRWSELERSFASLELSRSHSLRDLGFMLVGGRILDIGMLGALVDDGSLLPPAPPRPSPERSDGHYYLWMVEGDLEHLGRYGQYDTELPRANWYFLTFGQNMVSGNPNPPRESLEQKYEDLLAANSDGSPELFARELNVLLMSRDDSDAWASVTERFSADLVASLRSSGPDIPGFFRTLQTGRSAEDSLGEFFVWYYHLAYAWAIDQLVEEGVITIPPERFSSLILYREGEEGLLRGF
jgi:hypothetical protein